VETIYREVIDLEGDGSFRLNQNDFNSLAGLTMTRLSFDDLSIGPPRVPESRLTQREMDLARSIQAVCEEIMRRMARAEERL
jgi:carbamoyltransferase